MAHTITALDTFTRAYVECALWSSHDESNDQGGEPMDANYDVSDIAPTALDFMAKDCEDFQSANADLLAEFDITTERAGHDFWLTRNRHGAGFWDEWSAGRQHEIGELLTKAAHAYGESNLYVGDDGQIYAQ